MRVLSDVFNIQVCRREERGKKINCKKENSDFRCSPKVWFERRAAAAENAAVSAVLEEVKGITESLTMSSKEGVGDKAIEEKAIEELRKFYNVDHCQDEVITISRQPRGTIAAPIWRKKKN